MESVEKAARPTGSSYAWVGVAILVVLALAGVTLVVGLGVAHLMEQRETAAGPLPQVAPVGGSTPAGGPTSSGGSAPTSAGTQPVVSDVSPVDPREAMQARYRAGPYVALSSMLPSDRVRPANAPGSWLSRAGRTIPNPWLVGHGEIRAAQIPGPAGTPDAPVASLHDAAPGPLSIVAGVPNRVQVRVTDPQGSADVVGFIVGFERYQGHFYVPVGAPDELGNMAMGAGDVTPIDFGIDAAVHPDGSPMTGNTPYPVTMWIAAVDRAGRVSAYVMRQLQVMPVGTGDVEVTLTMSEPTDLDLYVQEPTGQTVWFRNTQSFTGGHLDLDANAGCSSNLGVNNEHIFWPPGRAPAGTYTVRVANYESCIQGRPVEYSITIRNCGETVVLQGRFEGQGTTDHCTSPPGNRYQWCQEVVSFQVTPCESIGVPATGGAQPPGP
ncbi:MAG: hypothetical protein IT379_36775 [Deltaproteobacteria bacterium]|nr:hypothetical protein [Deltaproteobacteria bacterium]